MNGPIIVFPGQASQRVGMLKELALRFSLVQETFAEVSDVVGYDIWKLVQYGPVEELNRTIRAQPAILATSIAIWRVWKHQGGCMPEMMAGHSLGEYSALVCAESIDLSVAANLVMIRGQLMQEAMPYGCGAMSVIIGLDDNIVCELCKVAEQGQIVAPSCFNAPGHVVVSGHKEAVHRVNDLCKQAGAKYVFVLPISVPSHCLLMKPVVKKFRKALEKIIIRKPVLPILNNSDMYITKDPAVILDVLVRQLYTPVCWSEIIRYVLYQKSILKFIEMGPGRTLTRFIYSIVEEDNIHNVCSVSVNDPISLLEAMKII